jgi:ornithine carbamoyltransferase
VDGEAYFGVVSAFSPPAVDVCVLDVVVAVELELELAPLDPQPATSSAAAQASAMGHVDWRATTVSPHFLTGAELSAAELDTLLDRALELKAAPLSSRALTGRSVALIFQKPSTRTRISFEVGVHELGGNAIVLRADELQLSRGEALRDTAYVLSRHVSAVGVRTGPDAMLEELARYSDVPVVNMLTTLHHPCQALADLLTLRESYGTLRDVRVAYVGDGNNVARSLALLGTLAGMQVAVASPPGYTLDEQAMPLPVTDGARGTLELHTDPRAAVAGAQAVYADVWVSMGDEATATERRAALAPYKLDAALLDAAAPGAFAMHDLPAHPGEEISAEILYGKRQRIWDQAENRRHAQKALLESLLAPASDSPPQ